MWRAAPRHPVSAPGPPRTGQASAAVHALPVGGLRLSSEGAQDLAPCLCVWHSDAHGAALTRHAPAHLRPRPADNSDSSDRVAAAATTAITVFAIAAVVIAGGATAIYLFGSVQ